MHAARTFLIAAESCPESREENRLKPLGPSKTPHVHWEVLGDDTTAFVSAIGACEQRQLHQEALRTMALLEDFLLGWVERR